MSECTANSCTVELTDGIALCHDHTSRLEAALREVPATWQDIQTTACKYARASAGSPLAESGSIVLPEAELLPGVEELLEEAKNFPNSAHDDAVDALSQTVNRLLLMPLTGLEDDVVPR